MSLIWDSAAKYIQGTERQASVKAKQFYFTSDYLIPAGKTYILNAGASGTADITFQLRNYDGLHKSELDISYTVTVDPAVAPEFSGNKTITVAEQSEAVTLKGLLPGNSYTVTVVGQNGYQQTLSATFEVAPVERIMFKNTKNNGDHVILTVWTEGLAGTASITVPTGLIPDATDDALTTKHAGDTVTVTLEKDESRPFRFFTTVDYAGGNIPVTHNGNPVDEAPLS